MAQVKFCPHCPASGVCGRCDGPIDEAADAIARRPQCLCGSPMRAVELREDARDETGLGPCRRFAIGCASTYSVSWRDLFHLPYGGQHDFLYVEGRPAAGYALACGGFAGTSIYASGRAMQACHPRYR